MKNYLLFLFLLTTCFGYSQDSFRKLTRNGERSLKSGDFITANIKASQALLQKPSFKKSIALFENTIRVVYKKNELKIEGLKKQAIPYKNFNSVEKVNKIIGIYKRLQEVRINASLITNVNFKTIKSPLDFGKDFTSDIDANQALFEEYKVLAAEDFYALGNDQFSKAQTKEQFLQASNNFKRVGDFVQNYKDAKALEEETLGIFNQMSAEQLYNEASAIYDSAGYKKDYQRAYYVFIQIEKFVPNFKNTNELIASCVDLGTFRVAFMNTSKASRFGYELSALHDQAKAHARNLAFVEVVEINVDGVTNLDILIRYLKSGNKNNRIDHIYKFSMDNFNVSLENRKEVLTQEKTKKIKKDDVETTISGSFTKVSVSSRAIANAYLEVVDFNTSNTVSLVNLSENIFDTSRYWIYNEGNKDAFVNLKHTLPLISNEDQFIQNANNNLAARLRNIMKNRVNQKQLELYN